MNGDGKVARSLTRALTNVIKLAGLVIALHELLFRAQLRPLGVAVAVFMMAGGQFSEEVILAVLDRVLGSTPDPKPRKVTKRR